MKEVMHVAHTVKNTVLRNKGWCHYDRNGRCGQYSQKAVILNREMDWEDEKRRYVHLVKRHMNENPGPTQDIMGELLNLMSHVADHTPACDGRRWQHPSDLTRRNYQHLSGNAKPKMTLRQWQANNHNRCRHFANIPKIFTRSPFPKIRSCGQFY